MPLRQLIFCAWKDELQCIGAVVGQRIHSMKASCHVCLVSMFVLGALVLEQFPSSFSRRWEAFPSSFSRREQDDDHDHGAGRVRPSGSSLNGCEHKFAAAVLLACSLACLLALRV